MLPRTESVRLSEFIYGNPIVAGPGYSDGYWWMRNADPMKQLSPNTFIFGFPSEELISKLNQIYYENLGDNLFHDEYETGSYG